MDANNQVQVTGPIENKLVFLGLLEIAKETALEYHRKAAARTVQLASAAEVPPAFGPMNGRG